MRDKTPTLAVMSFAKKKDRQFALQQGLACESDAVSDYTSRGYVTIPLRKGADFLALKKGEAPRLVEAKYCNSQLSPLQRQVRQLAEKIDLEYDEYHCGCVPRKTG